MPDMKRLEDELPEGIDAGAVMDACKAAGYKLVPDDGSEESAEAATDPGQEAMPKEPEEDEGDDESEESGMPGFMTASRADRLSAVKGFLDDEKNK